MPQELRLTCKDLEVQVSNSFNDLRLDNLFSLELTLVAAYYNCSLLLLTCLKKISKKVKRLGVYCRTGHDLVCETTKS